MFANERWSLYWCFHKGLTLFFISFLARIFIPDTDRSRSTELGINDKPQSSNFAHASNNRRIGFGSFSFQHSKLLSAGEGGLLISNDAGKMGDYTEALFKLKRAQIIYWNHTTCSVAAGKFCFSNGITNQAGKVYLASTIQNKIWKFDFKDGKMINQQVIAKVNGADNIRICDGNLYVACHLRFLDFLKHMKNAAHYSPTMVYKINPVSMQKSVVFFDDGAKLSAGSTGLSFHNKLYVSGVFDAKMAIADEAAEPER